MQEVKQAVSHASDRAEGQDPTFLLLSVTMQTLPRGQQQVIFRLCVRHTSHIHPHICESINLSLWYLQALGQLSLWPSRFDDEDAAAVLGYDDPSRAHGLLEVLR